MHSRKAEIRGVSSPALKPYERLRGTWVQRQCIDGYLSLSGTRVHVLQALTPACSVPGLALDPALLLSREGRSE